MSFNEMFTSTKNQSILVGFITFIIVSILLALLKPYSITKLTDGYKRVIDWPRLLLMATIFGLTATICMFLVKSKDVNEYENDSPAKMSFGISY